MDWHLVAQIGVPIFCLLAGAAIQRKTERRAKLIAYYGHVASFRLGSSNPEDAPTEINTHSIIVRNGGGLAAHNLRITHNYLPPNFHVYPPRPYTRSKVADGTGEELLFPTIAPQEQFTIYYLYFPPLTYSAISTQIVSDEGIAQVLNVIPTPQDSRRDTAIKNILQIVGAVTVLYWAVMGIRHLTGI